MNLQKPWFQMNYVLTQVEGGGGAGGGTRGETLNIIWYEVVRYGLLKLRVNLRWERCWVSRWRWQSDSMSVRGHSMSRWKSSLAKPNAIGNGFDIFACRSKVKWPPKGNNYKFFSLWLALWLECNKYTPIDWSWCILASWLCALISELGWSTRAVESDFKKSNKSRIPKSF